MRELKLQEVPDMLGYSSRTPPGVRELKPSPPVRPARGVQGRTPPGVRELKPLIRNSIVLTNRRTPPGVRELKHFFTFNERV